MQIDEDSITTLAPQELGILMPFQYGYQPAGAALLKWDISYLYAELWVAREDEIRLVISFLPEFTTDSFRPCALRVALTPPMVDQLEKQRRGGDLLLTVHIQATLTGTVRRDQVQDPARRKTLEALGVEEEIFGPIRRSDNVLIRVRRSAWEDVILPQWSPAELHALAVSGNGMQRFSVSGAAPDMTAVARSLQGAGQGATLEDILGLFPDPIVGL
ncbi:MAG: hypothetical protein EXR53_06170 [Dehalococcoidia bacterium]|nr:hypothetical protein [Dehalococcoidia bacterium]